MQKEAVEAFYGPLLIGGVVWWVASFWPGDGDHWTDRLWHSLWYAVPMEQVRIDPKLPDCDFLYAPIGRKGCHFKRTVAVYNSAGVLIGGDKYDRDVWSAFLDQRAKSVVVTWTRTKD